MRTVAAAATSGKIVPPTPTASWVGYSSGVSTFTLSGLVNYATYALTPTTGTASLDTSTGSLTVNTTSDFEVTISPVGRKGSLAGTAKIVGKKAITYYAVTTTTTSQGGCINGVYNPGCPCGFCEGACTGSCEGDGCCYEFATTTTTTTNYYPNSPPAGYTTIGGWWIRL